MTLHEFLNWVAAFPFQTTVLKLNHDSLECQERERDPSRPVAVQNPITGWLNPLFSNQCSRRLNYTYSIESGLVATGLSHKVWGRLQSFCCVASQNLDVDETAMLTLSKLLWATPQVLLFCASLLECGLIFSSSLRCSMLRIERVCLISQSKL